MKVLQLCYKLPFYTNNDKDYSLHNSTLSLISQDINLTILAMNRNRLSSEIELMSGKFEKEVNFQWIQLRERGFSGKSFMNLFGQHSSLVTRIHSEDYNDAIQRILLEDDYDIVLLEHLYLCHYIPTIRGYSKARIILRAQHVEQEMWYRYAAGTKNLVKRQFLNIAVKRLAEFENISINEVDGIIALSDKIRHTYRVLGSRVPIKVIPLGISFDGLVLNSKIHPDEDDQLQKSGKMMTDFYGELLGSAG